MSSKVESGITKDTFGEFYDPSEEGYVQWDTDGHKEFGLPEGVDPRIDALYQFARELKATYPPGKALPQDIQNTLTPGLDMTEQREQFIARKLNDAIENGVTIAGVKYEGFGPYNPIVAASLGRQGKFKAEMYDLQRQVDRNTPSEAKRELDHAVGEKEDAIRTRQEGLRGLRDNWPEELTAAYYQLVDKAIGGVTGEELQKAIEDDRLKSQRVSIDVVNKLAPSFDIANSTDREIVIRASQIVDTYEGAARARESQLKSEIESLESEIAVLEEDYEQRVPGLIAEAKGRISELKDKIEEEEVIMREAVPEDDRTKSGNWGTSESKNFKIAENVCRHQNAFAMVLGEEAGLELIGVGGYMTSPGEVAPGPHYYVISATTGNVIDITGSPESSYGVSQRELEPSDMMLGHTNVFRFSNDSLRAYGTGYQHDIADVLEARENGSGKTGEFDEFKVAAYDNILMRAVRDNLPHPVDNTKYAAVMSHSNEPIDLPWATIEQQKEKSDAYHQYKELRSEVGIWDSITGSEKSVELKEAQAEWRRLSDEHSARFEEYREELMQYAEDRQSKHPEKKEWVPKQSDWKNATGQGEEADGPTMRVSMNERDNGQAIAANELAHNQSQNQDPYIG